jgi:hypothetical protein
MPIDFWVLALKDFDVILGMNWLSVYYASMNYHKKWVSFYIPGQLEFYFDNDNRGTLKFISSLKAKRLLQKGC